MRVPLFKKLLSLFLAYALLSPILTTFASEPDETTTITAIRRYILSARMAVLWLPTRETIR